MDFELKSEFKPTGDQPQAIKSIVSAINNNEKYSTLLGVTGSGKTFTMANIIQEVKMPTLILAHNKTLAAQLYSEFKEFFPDNAVEYFSLLFIALTIDFIACGWSPVGLNSDFNSKSKSLTPFFNLFL